MILRQEHVRRVLTLLERNPVAAILGPRQVGKTTLARQVREAWRGPSRGFDLENPSDLGRLDEPMLALGGLDGLVVVDEVQRRPDLFPILRVLADRPRRRTRFLVLGSASPHLLRQSSESLAGRIAFHDLPGFNLHEVGVERRETLWVRGGFPRSFLARSAAASFEWRRDFVQTFLERELPQLGIAVASPTLRRFWSMLAHYHGQIFNASELGRAFAVSHHAVSRYLNALVSTFMVRRLPPWHENLRKRQVKAPKVYVKDSGLLHSLLGLESKLDLEGHPKVGASWEGFALEAVVAAVGARPEECFFWATHAGAELDLLWVRGRHRRGFEFKLSDAPRVTPSMRVAMGDLKLDGIDVVHAGTESYPLARGIRAVAIGRLFKDFK